MKWFDAHLRKINVLLVFIIVLINGYVLITPFLPQVGYYTASVISKPDPIDTKEERSKIDTSYEHLVIPKMQVDDKVWIGDSERLLDKGVWHIPDSSTPDKGSNTVLAGHRFTYKDEPAFYHLDKLGINDPVALVWGGKIYSYRVDEIKVVEPTDTYIEDPTEESILTLYTCTPLWTSKQRLVVIAKLEAVE